VFTVRSYEPADEVGRVRCRVDDVLSEKVL
jgi:hypothetical protein